ncbi:MAG TPA: class I SAM-dependent methyltransferase [Thermomicrobiales bacterium]|nr:class I SAM-dependent methyltransferase [Thermomicrobiales bacterium]
MTTSPVGAHPAEHVARPSEQSLLDAWRQLVEAHAQQTARLRETAVADDFWGTGYGGSTVDMERPAPQCAVIADLLQPDDTLLDIGAGFGGTMLPLASRVSRVTALDPSPGMTTLLKRNISQHGITNVDVLEPDAWPPTRPIERHDVCLCAFVIYEVPDIGAFLDAMERHARRLCILAVAERGTGFTPVEPFFERLHGERHIRQPALRETLAVLGARRRRFDVRTYPFLQFEPEDIDSALDFWRGNYFVREGSEKDGMLRQLLLDEFGVGGTQVAMPHPAGTHAAIISWEPPRHA